MQVVLDRRALHQIPELGMELPKTAAYIRKALEGLKCEVFSPLEHAVCAYFDFGAADAIAFRADADHETGTFAESIIHRFAVLINDWFGNKSLNGTGESAAVHAAGAAGVFAVEKGFADGQGNSEFLSVRRVAGMHILKKFIR